MDRFEGADAEVRAALVVVAGHGLPGDEHRPPPAAPLDDAQWRALVRLVQIERLLGLLDRAVAAGALPATDEQRADAEEAAAQGLRQVLFLERRLLAAAAALDGAGVPFLVLKGAAVARLDEAHPSLRHYNDVDLLVRGDDVGRAVAALAAIGYGRDLPERRPGYDRRFAKEVSLADDLRTEVDLHRVLALGAFGLAAGPAALWSSTDRLEVGGTALAALDAEGRFAHACVNAMLGDERPRLVALRDVAVISTAHRLRPGRLGSLLPAGRGAAVAGAACAAVTALLGPGTVGAEAAAYAGSVPPSRWERAALRAYRAHGGSNTLELLSGTMALAGMDRLRYLQALVVPGSAYRAARREAGRPREWTTGVREVLSRRGKSGG
ncbi:MAG TPA: nucleotidyltransferase family protein [Acidimicrobiales bacterium]|nr:nucleotidyltransferase family protein [Acidimicrobiales bacterium]